MAGTETLSLAELFPSGMSGKRIHFIGAGGPGISSAIWLARQHGALVSGCDISASAGFRALQSDGIAMALGHDAAHSEDADLVVYTPFITHRNPDLPELVIARERGIPTRKWQELLGYLMRGYTGVSVAGVHGKGSTTALLGSLAVAGGLDPTVEVGAISLEWSTNSRHGHSPYFLNEADEWDYNFLNYHPRVVVLTAVEYDHPEFYPSYEVIRDAFVSFIRGMDMSEHGDDGTIPPTLILNADSPGCLDVLRLLGEWPGVVRTFGLDTPDVDARGEGVFVGGETSFTLCLRGEQLGRVSLSTPGRHNVYNAVAAACAADALGVSRGLLVPALTHWPGLRRRFEIVEDGDVTFVDDYAHHPHAVALTLETARERFPGRRVIAVFQPTLYTRLHRFLTPFSEAFDLADEAIIVEIQPSRESDTGLIHGSALSEKIAQRPAFADRLGAARYGGNVDETAALLRELRRPGDVVVVMGSGPVNAVIAGARKVTAGG